MKLTLLGTGTSQGVPIIGCDCEVCQSVDPRDKRLRSAALLEADGVSILIDAGPDLRQQMLREKVKRLDAILLTHEHTDHVIGLDDVRPFNFSSGQAMSVYAEERVANEVRKRFEYVFGTYIPGLPQINLFHIGRHDVLDVKGVQVQCIGVEHGRLPILGFRFGDLTYITDMKTMLPEEREKVRGTKFLVVNALHHLGHYSHMNLEEALAFIADVQPEKAWLTHISHSMGLAAKVEPDLPENVHLGYDGMVIEF